VLINILLRTSSLSNTIHFCAAHLSPTYSRHFTFVKELACPIQPVRACISTELSAFQSLAWSSSNLLLGRLSSKTGAEIVWRSPGPAPGRTTCSALFRSLFHLLVKSSSAFCFSKNLYYSACGSILGLIRYALC
jgi:hypothetical protein